MTRNEASLMVVVLDDRKENPIYHRRGEGDFVSNRPHVQWYSQCGHSVGYWCAWLRRDHATAFARPCKRCFPGASA